MIRLAGLLALVTVPAAANAELEMPTRKPGLWEISMSTVGVPSGGKYEMKQCIDESTDAKLLKGGMDMASQMGMQCTKNDMHKDSDQKYSGDSECSFNGVQTKTTTVFSGDFDKAYTGEIKTSYTPAMMGITSSVTTLQAKHAGKCPKDMKPGDMLLPGGMKMNVNDVPAAPKAN